MIIEVLGKNVVCIKGWISTPTPCQVEITMLAALNNAFQFRTVFQVGTINYGTSCSAVVAEHHGPPTLYIHAAVY